MAFAALEAACARPGCSWARGSLFVYECGRCHVVPRPLADDASPPRIGDPCGEVHCPTCKLEAYLGRVQLPCDTLYVSVGLMTPYWTRRRRLCEACERYRAYDAAVVTMSIMKGSFMSAAGAGPDKDRQLLLRAMHGCCLM